MKWVNLFVNENIIGNEWEESSFSQLFQRLVALKNLQKSLRKQKKLNLSISSRTVFKENIQMSASICL